MAARDHRPPWRGDFVDSHEIFPSMYERNLREEKYVENISNPARTQRLPALAWDMRGQLQFSVRVLKA